MYETKVLFLCSGDYPAEPQHGGGTAEKPTPALYDGAYEYNFGYTTKLPPPPPPPVLIAVMGKTGTGKTSFINAITGGEGGLRVGHGLESCTQDIQTASATISGREVWLVDTPGFDDTNRSDVDILASIADWVKQASQDRKHLSGIIYFHRIVDPRMEGSNMKNLKMFRELCGDKNFNNVILLTTMWDKVDEEEGRKREEELKSRAGFWGNLISRGAQVKRHRGPDFTASAREIAQPLIEKDTIVLQLQEELGGNRSLSDTSAGRFLTGEIEVIRKKHQEEMEELKAEMHTSANKEEIKLLKECYQQEIQGLKRVTDEMEKLRAQDQQHFQRRMEEMQQRWDSRPQHNPVCIIS
ncbi:P-loop containing nucleoside triphosphate hydrolase protein [Tuber magnatum]|uniref:P-loop containing nucleoside triphosphate hydrolase protein n=1 Tax=Tuber magnatum TaxID=42249 RepID=A0A317SCC9_9PEZI|nr:P-loop containing nucleoside triphosphate hydrolase protein [Tuber magnatum]